jgi:hypothetical protein
MKKNELKVMEFLEEKTMEEKSTEEKTICDLCGVDYTGSTKEEHEERRFHKNYV